MNRAELAPRLARAKLLEETPQSVVRCLDEPKPYYLVHSATKKDEWYRVENGATGSCQCEDWQKNANGQAWWCKHRLAVLIALAVKMENAKCQDKLEYLEAEAREATAQVLRA